MISSEAEIDPNLSIKQEPEAEIENVFVEPFLDEKMVKKLAKQRAAKLRISRHLNEADGQVYLYCPECEFSTVADHDMRKHRRYVHSSSQRYNCDECNFITLKKELLDAHTRDVHNKERKYVCEQCGFAFNQRFQLKRHIDWVHRKDKSFSCDECSFTFFWASNLRRHKATVHQKIKPLKCTLCSYSCAKGCNLKRHMASKHGDKDRQGKTQPKRKSSSQGRTKKSTPEFELKSKDINQIDELKEDDNQEEEIELVEEEQQDPLSSENPKYAYTRLRKIKKFMCSICNYCYSKSYNVKRHMKIVHGVEDGQVLDAENLETMENQGCIDTNIQPLNSCNFCGASFITKEALAFHYPLHTDNEHFLEDLKTFLASIPNYLISQENIDAVQEYNIKPFEDYNGDYQDTEATTIKEENLEN